MILQLNLDKIARVSLSASREAAKSKEAQDPAILKLMLTAVSKVAHIYQREMTTMRRISVSTNPSP
jgi:hypothetical protein